MTTEKFQEVVKNVLFRAFKELKFNKNKNALNYIAALSDYQDQFFNFKNKPLPAQYYNPKSPESKT
jgi:hypothetical protein